MMDFERIFFPILYLLFLPFYFLIRKKKGYFFLHSVVFIYIVGVISVTFFPFPIMDLREEIINNHYPNWIPLTTISQMLQSGRWHIIYRQLLGNLVLLLPLGFFIPLLSSKETRWMKVLKIGFLSSLGIESLQLLISQIVGYTYKIFDVDDLLLNTLGAVMGYGLWELWVWVKGRLKVGSNGIPS